MSHKITRTIKLNKPTQAYIVTGRGKNKTATLTAIQDAANDITQLITLVHDEVQSQLNLPQAYHDKALLKDYQAWAEEFDAEHNRSTTNQIVQVAIRSGLNAPITTLPSEISVKSRVSWLILGHYASLLKAWDGDPRHKPNAGWTVNLGYVNASMARVTQGGKWVKLYLKAWDREIVLVFRKPSCSLRKGEKLGLPIISMNKSGDLSYGFPVQEKIPLPAITDRYVIGVDRGISKFYTAAVIDTATQQVIVSVDSTGVIEEARLKVKRQDDQVRGLRAALERAITKRDYRTVRILQVELDRVRKARSRLKVQLCRDAARELVGLAEEFGNAVICFEELNWSGAWGSREPYGLFLHEVEWLVEKRGLLCYKVPAAYSSQSCSGHQAGSYKPGLHEFIGRLFVCLECGLLEDRDVNAAVNLAVRGVGRAVKSAGTRSRSKECATPKRARRGLVKIRFIIHNDSLFNDWLAGGGVACGSRLSVPSGQYVRDTAVLTLGSGVGLAKRKVFIMRLRV